MEKYIQKTVVLVIVIQILLFQNCYLVKSEVPVIASRVSGISEISRIIYSENTLPNKTMFSMNVASEILNRDSENYTVIDLADCWPKVIINATFVNQAFELEEDIMCQSTIMHYSYHPGITHEYEKIEFYINQSDLTQLPDGNYTLFRPVNTASSLGWVDPAEILLTRIEVSSGDIKIIYPDFVVFTIPELSNVITISFVLSSIVLGDIIFQQKKQKERRR